MDENADHELPDPEFGPEGLIKRAKEQFPDALVSAAECTFGGAPKLNEIDDEFIYDFASLVFERRDRYTKRDYEKTCRELPSRLTKAADILYETINVIRELEHEDRLLIWESARLVMKRIRNDATPKIELYKTYPLELRLHVAADWLRALSSTSEILKQKYAPTGGRSPLPYEQPTRELLLCWQKWSPGGSVPMAVIADAYEILPIPTARKIRAKRGEREKKSKEEQVVMVAGNRSTRFVQIGLTLLDPSISLEQVVTSINNVRKNPVDFDVLKDIPKDMEDLLFRWLPENATEPNLQGNKQNKNKRVQRKPR